jgi:hypothetical protein
MKLKTKLILLSLFRNLKINPNLGNLSSNLKYLITRSPNKTDIIVNKLIEIQT